MLGDLWLPLGTGAPPGACAVVVATAVLAAATKGPVSAVILMLELTGRLDGALLPMLIAVVGAVTVAHRLDLRSIYTSRLAADSGDGHPRSVTAATRFAELLRRSTIADEALRVSDAAGREIGRLTRADLAAARPPDLLAITTAVDLVEAQSKARVTGCERAKAQ